MLRSWRCCSARQACSTPGRLYNNSE